MFNFRSFVKKGLIDAVGKQADHWVILNAAGWHEKGVLLEEDLKEINALIEARNAPLIEPTEDK
ncbi:MAG: hypothetical protein U0M60_03330 [Clostridia bacterium]|nr:hypothetical protein [Clostridia bacterium]